MLTYTSKQQQQQKMIDTSHRHIISYVGFIINNLNYQSQYPLAL